MSIFSSISLRRPKRNKFDLSHERKMSMQMGKLYPLLVQEILPGDSFRVSSEIMMRLTPLVAPVMHRVNVFTHFFFVPNRLVWDEFKDFITGGRLGTSEPVAPYFTANNAADFMKAPGKLADYMGLPVISASAAVDDISISALPFRAYQLVYDEYYRDQNLAASLDLSKASGEVTGAELTKIMTLRTRAWEKDYFTSALPWAQRGGAVSSPIVGTVDPGDRADGGMYTGSVRKSSDDSLSSTGAIKSTLGVEQVGTSENVYHEILGEGTVEGDLDINELRRSIKLQEWLEKNARGGARYIEQILSHFGVKSSDGRLQRPEYLGGGKSPVVISEVLSTVESSDGEVPQANMAGHGVAIGRTNGFKRSFEEHGFVIGVMSVLPRTAYQQGVPRMFSRADKYDYYWPEFAQLGEQEVKLKELYYDSQAASGTAEETFGYQSRYAEYKYMCSSVHGEFKDTLAFWHMGRIFEAEPSLNESFVASDPTTRIFAVETGDTLLAQVYNRVDALRPMPYFNVPSL